MPRRDTTSGRHPNAAVALAVGAAAASVILPDRLRIDHRFPFVDAIAWRPHAAAAALALSGVLAARRGARPAAVALAAVALAGAGSVVGRAVVAPRPAPAIGDLTILTVNVLRGRADTGELATLIERSRPDFVVIPEAGSDFRDKLMPLLEMLGHRSWVSTGPGIEDSSGVVLLAAERAGDVRVSAGSEMRMRHLEATGGILGGRTLYAAHTTAPVWPGVVCEWRADMAVLRRWCAGPVAPIVAGDLNATLDHRMLRAALGGCRSAAAGTGRGLVATYPASLPRQLGIQIDHVLVPADAVTTRFEVLDIAGSDHRGVLAAVRLPDRHDVPASRCP